MSSSPPSLLLSLPPEPLLLIVNYLNRRGWAFLARECCAMDCLLAIKLDDYFEDNDVDPNRMVRNSSVPPLTAAGQGGNFKVVRMLLKVVANVNYPPATVGGWIAVAQAHWHGNAAFVVLWGGGPH